MLGGSLTRVAQNPSQGGGKVAFFAILRGSCTTGQFHDGRVRFPPGPLQDIKAKASNNHITPNSHL